jgi:hypothetical protein
LFCSGTRNYWLKSILGSGSFELPHMDQEFEAGTDRSRI